MMHGVGTYRAGQFRRFWRGASLWRQRMIPTRPNLSSPRTSARSVRSIPNQPTTDFTNPRRRHSIVLRSPSHEPTVTSSDSANLPLEDYHQYAACPPDVAMHLQAGGGSGPSVRPLRLRLSQPATTILLAATFLPMALGHGGHHTDKIPEGETVSLEPMVCWRHVKLKWPTVG